MWIFKYCKGNNALGDDIYSQTIIKCWQKIKTFKGDSKFSTWANSIARREFLNEYRKNTRYDFIDLDSCANLSSKELKNVDVTAETHPEHTAIEELRPSSKMEKLERIQQSQKIVTKMMSKLTYDDRNILRLYHYDDLGYKQISKMLKIPVGTVMSRLYYARRKALRILELLKK